MEIAKPSNMIENRRGHTAVLTSNDEIIIYGGSGGVSDWRVIPDLFVLNTNTEQFEFTIPPVTSKIGQIPFQLESLEVLDIGD
ncbi:7111_t:CDS:2, partial [Funneliformis caledonium]